MNFILAKSGNAWLRHLKKTPRESAFSRVPRNTRWFRFHTALLLKLFSTGRRPVCARGRPPMSLQFPIALSFLSPFLFNLRIFTIYFRSTDLESLIRIHSPIPLSPTLFPYPFLFTSNVVQRVETFVEFEATKWIVSRRGGK